MKTSIAAVLGLAAAVATSFAHADGRRDGAEHPLRTDSKMQVVANGATRGEPGHGWQYFAEAGGARAVVISPRGDYFYSDGHGLMLAVESARSGPARAAAPFEL
jgi:hypothetical protein